MRASAIIVVGMLFSFLLVHEAVWNQSRPAAVAVVGMCALFAGWLWHDVKKEHKP